MDTNGGDSAGRVAKWVVALVLLLPLLLFAPSLANGFAMDGESLASSEWKENPGQPDPVISELHGPGFNRPPRSVCEGHPRGDATAWARPRPLFG